MGIKLIEDKSLWDKFVDESRDGLLFHKWDSLKIMEKHSNCKLLPYGIYNGDVLVCIFPIFFKKSKGLKTFFSPPYGTGIMRLGFVMNRDFYTLSFVKQASLIDLVVEEFDKEIKRISPNYVSISLVQNFLNIRSFEWKNYGTKAHFTYITDLSPTLEEIWNGFTKTLRKQIRQVDGSNLKLLQSNDISMFYESEKNRYEKKGLNPQIRSKKYPEDLFETYPECLKLLYLYDSNDVIISMQIICEYKDTSTMWMGAAKGSGKMHYNEYMDWELIKLAKNSGYKKIDWGGGTQTISKYKLKFNPTLGFYFNIYKKDNLGKFAEWAYLNFIQRIYRY